ncbi:MAG: hypothetical protein KDA77_04375, partial [Planctomycetaceae bacterium]|nr:hypothetical protein [Planctomycetaceae bacterium]
TLQETPELKQKGIQLIPFDSDKPASEYVLYFQRTPYLPEILQPQQSNAWQVVTEVTHQGVALARLIRLNHDR